MDQQVSVERITKGLLFGWLVSIVVTAAVMLSASLLMYLTEMGSGSVKVIVFIIYFLSAMAGGWVAGHKIKYRKFLWGLAAGALYYLIVCVLSALSGGMAGEGFNVRLSAVLMCLGSGMLGGMLG